MFEKKVIFAQEDMEHCCPRCNLPTYVVWFGTERPYPDGDIVEVTERTEIRKCCLCGKTWASAEALLAEATGSIRAEDVRWKFCGNECPLKKAAGR